MDTIARFFLARASDLAETFPGWLPPSEERNTPVEDPSTGETYLTWGPRADSGHSSSEPVAIRRPGLWERVGRGRRSRQEAARVRRFPHCRLARGDPFCMWLLHEILCQETFENARDAWQPPLLLPPSLFRSQDEGLHRVPEPFLARLTAASDAGLKDVAARWAEERTSRLLGLTPARTLPFLQALRTLADQATTARQLNYWWHEGWFWRLF